MRTNNNTQKQNKITTKDNNKHARPLTNTETQKKKNAQGNIHKRTHHGHETKHTQDKHTNNHTTQTTHNNQTQNATHAQNHTTHNHNQQLRKQTRTRHRT